MTLAKLKELAERYQECPTDSELWADYAEATDPQTVLGLIEALELAKDGLWEISGPCIRGHCSSVTCDPCFAGRRVRRINAILAGLESR